MKNKNIWLLSTDKPSRLVLNSINNDLFLTTTKKFPSDIMKFKNIYITSDEEIKVGDWYINTFVSERVQKPQTHTEKSQLINHKKDYRFNYCKKIILTTDQDLIKDGIQAIDDEFLEWFVKNPWCESVDIETIMECEKCGKEHCDNLQCRGYKDIPYYKIIIPKEEPKQESLVERMIPLQLKYNLDMMKQETLNEVALEFAKDYHELYETNNLGAMHFGFCWGAKWQQEQDKNKYSEEEVYNIIEQAMKDCYSLELEKHYSGDYKNLKQYFEQFKKK